MCLLCRKRKPKRELLRLVRMPDGSDRYDPEKKAEGRGSYLCNDPECIETAAKKHRITPELRDLLLRETGERIGRTG